MCLPTPEVDRFYRVWKSLLFYANGQYQLIPAWKTANLETKLRSEDVLQVRERLWQDDGLREQFVAQNPARLSDADLALVENWKHRLQGDFVLFRVLKKHAIFLAQDHTGDVLAVKGLYSPFSEIFPFIPIMVKAVLLPYEGEIICDGLFQPYNVSFGSGIIGDWNAVYADAKERGRLLLPCRAFKSISPQEQKKKAEATTKGVG